MGDNVLVIWDEKNDEPQFVEIFHPTWISHLARISLSDKSINKVIEQYLKRGDSVDSFGAK